ncbi:MAG: hypothetical protein A2Z17_07680 [Gammaproteobacteria bacterium RBG_16_66_13]|nr:MAG: hypothetical protein A2Z17_07680 [Gammaproteobacteria bacterium RBG_16_66_13]
MIDDGRVKLLLAYDPIPDRREAYFNYVLGEFVPALEHLGLTMSEAWHTAYGAYPLRLAGFVASDRQQLEEVLASERFQVLEARLQEFVVNYTRRVVSCRTLFQY